jgi:SAM-dependent methyltransferase
MTSSDIPEDHPVDGIAGALEAHRARVDEVLPAGDPDEIKRLYVELGELIHKALGGDASEVPALSFPETAPVIAALASDLRGRILDAGCGPNPVFSIMLGGRLDRKLIGLDISPEIVKFAVDRARSMGVELFGVVGDCEALPFRESVIDGCICEDTIEHLPHDMKGAEEFARVLAPQGRLILGTPNRVRLDVLRRRLVDRLHGRRQPASAYYAATSHLREYTWYSLEQVVGPWFRVRGRATVGWTGGWKARALTTLVRRWPFRWFGRMVILDIEPRSGSSTR